MANLFNSYIGRKLLMSVSGLFLLLFLLVHLTVNSFLLFDWAAGTEEGQLFNAGVHFMGTNPLIKVIEPLLALGFAVHIIYSMILSAQNMRARGSQRYASGNATKGIEWSAKNMLPLGIAIFGFLVLHIANFYVKMKGFAPWEPAEVTFPFFGTEVHGEDGYTLVNSTFQILWVVIIYVIGCVALAIHLQHGFWSSFQTIGWNNKIWLVRLKVVGGILAWFIGGGFALIAILQYLLF